MAISNRADLRAEIALYMHRTDLTNNQLDNFIESAGLRLGTALRTQINEGRVALTEAVVDTGLYNLPADWNETRAVYSADNCLLTPLGQTEAERIDPNGNTARGYLMVSGLETTVAIAQYQLQLVPPTGEDITLHYYQNCVLQSDAHPALTRYPYLYLYACLIEAHTFVQDFPMRDQMLALFTEELRFSNEMAGKARLAPGAGVAPAQAQVASARPVRSM